GLTNLVSPVGGTGAYTYQWQSSINGGTTWSNIAGATNANYNPGALVTTTEYQRKETSGACGTVISNAITITVNGALAAGTIGTAQTICYNTAPASLTTVTNPTGGSGVYTYQWASSPDNVTWSNISGATNNNYSPGVLTTTTYYQLQITDVTCGGPVTTASVKITVDPIFVVGTVSANQTICYNTTPAKLNNVTLPTGGSVVYTYQWQSSPDNTTWTNITGATATSLATASMGNLTAITYYRRQETDNAGCGSGYSTVITITVDAPLANGSVGSNQTICNGATPAGLANITSPSGGSGTYTYQW